MHSTPPAPATTALTKPPPSSQGHFCGICNKQFDRREYENSLDLLLQCQSNACQVTYETVINVAVSSPRLALQLRNGNHVLRACAQRCAATRPILPARGVARRGRSVGTPRCRPATTQEKDLKHMGWARICLGGWEKPRL